VLAVVEEDLCESAIVHVESVVRIHEIDIRMDIEIEGHKEKQGFGLVPGWCIQDLLDLRGDVRLLECVKRFKPARMCPTLLRRIAVDGNH
jgi:hypothetical protein